MVFETNLVRTFYVSYQQVLTYFERQALTVLLRHCVEVIQILLITIALRILFVCLFICFQDRVRLATQQTLIRRPLKYVSTSS